MPKSDYLTGPIVPNVALRELLIDAGALLPAERRGTSVTFWHSDVPTLRMLGDEDTRPVRWSHLRKEEDR